MKKLASTIATIWRLSIPYFRSDDRWAGRALLGAVIAIELSLVAIQVILNQWYNRFYNTLQDHNWDAFVSAILFFCVTGGRLYRARGLSDLPQSMAADPLAALDDANLSAAMAQCRQSLPHAASRRRRRQPGPAHRRGPADVRGIHAYDRHRLAQFHRDALLVHRHSVDPFRASAAASVRRAIRYSRLSGMGGADLRRDRHRAHASDRLAAHSA